VSAFGCYTLDLYCDVPCEQIFSHCAAKKGQHRFKEFPHQFTDELGSECRKMARQAGWVFKRDGTTVCPRCSGKARK
jgi:hypothetical protein